MTGKREIICVRKYTRLRNNERRLKSYPFLELHSYLTTGKLKKRLQYYNHFIESRNAFN